jgi:integrase
MRYKERFTLFVRKTREGQAVYYVRFYDPRTGKRVALSTGESTKGRAREFAENLLAEGAVRDPRLEDFARDFFKWESCAWIARQHAKGRPFGRYQARTRRAHLENYIFPQFGKKRLAELTRPMIEDWLVSLDLANQTKNHMLYTLHIVLREAKSAKLIRDNPLQEMEPLGKNPRKRDVFTMEELRTLFPHDLAELTRIWKTPKYAALFIALATTGIRSGEARALLWRHLLAEGWLHVERAHKVDGTIGTTKTGEERVVALPRRTVEVLEWWRRQSPFTAEDHLMFFGMNAVTPLNVETVTHFLPGALQRAGVQITGRNLVVHSLRHTYNTIMRQVLPEEILRKLTGHKTPEMTQHYDHPGVQDRIGKLEGSRALIENVWK